MKKKLFNFLAFALFIIYITSMSVTAQAAQKSNVSIRPNITYTKYDITGDGKADKIRMNFKAQSYFNIEVNGKKRFSLNVRDIYSVYADLYTLKGNRHF